MELSGIVWNICAIPILFVSPKFPFAPSFKHTWAGSEHNRGRLLSCRGLLKFVSQNYRKRNAKHFLLFKGGLRRILGRVCEVTTENLPQSLFKKREVLRNSACGSCNSKCNMPLLRFDTRSVPGRESVDRSSRPAKNSQSERHLIQPTKISDASQARATLFSPPATTLAFPSAHSHPVP